MADAPGRAVDDQSVGERQQPLGPVSIEGRIRGPPQRHGQVVHEERDDDRRQVRARFTVSGDVDHFRAGFGPAC